MEEYYKAVIEEYSIDSRYLPYFMEEGFRFYWFIQAWEEAAAIEYPIIYIDDTHAQVTKAFEGLLQRYFG